MEKDMTCKVALVTEMRIRCGEVLGVTFAFASRPSGGLQVTKRSWACDTPSFQV